MIDRSHAERYKTNSEILNEVKRLNQDEKSSLVIRIIHNFILYGQLNNILCLEDRYILDEYISAHGLYEGVKIALIDIKSCLLMREGLKRAEISFEESYRELNKICEEIKSQNKIIDEEEYIKNLTDKELEIRYQPYPGGIQNLPDSVIYNQRIVNSGIEDNVEWIIFNKIHGYWFAVVTSLHRIKASGKKGCVQFKDMNWDNLQNQLRINIIKEKKLQLDFMSTRSKTPNINRVKAIMGIDNMDPNLNGDDIF